ncbi:MAG TPA: LCP family protein [Gaiellaceae bacterium]|jgi:LCP family protein required for cell wall assembly
MGRAATLNGNGRAVLPPTVAEPMRRYQPPPPPPRSTGRLIGKVFGWIALAVLVIGSGLAGGLYLYGHETLQGLAAKTPEAKASAKDLHPVATPSEPATALIVGFDQRAGADKDTASESRSDTIMLVRADPTNNTLSLLSFPRDLIVPIYCNGSEFPRTTDRINSAWTTCGERGTLDTVAHLTGIPVNYLITVDFHGFKLLVNKLHGVYVDVDHRYINTVGGPGGFAKIDLMPGYQKLNGQQALDFVRFRHTDSDLYRLARQQLFLEALKDRLASSLSLTEIPQILGAVKQSVVVVKPGAGAPTFGEIESYAGLGYHLPPGNIFRVSIDNVQSCGAFNAEICAQPSDITNAVDTFMHPDPTISNRADRAALGLKQKHVRTKALKPSEISTLVLNGTTEGGLAANTSYELAVAGFHTVQLPASISANTPVQNYTRTNVYYDPVQANAKLAASQLKVAIGAGTVIKALPPQIAPLAEQAGNPLVVVALGTSFSGKIIDPQTHIQKPPPHQPPNVRNDPGATESLLREAQPHFRVMVPNVIERSSQLSTLEPVRVFKPVRDHPELREVAMTFVTGASNVYWQVIETNWSDAPILRHQTGTYRIKGRRYQLFTSGGHIHMVVLRRGNGTYWVVNTLRDELSNETMLAIAKGLVLLRK